jgi:glucose-6-phosphate isomerase
LPELTSLPQWAALGALAKDTQGTTIAEQFLRDPERVSKYSLSCAGLYLDYSKNRVSDQVKDALLELAQASAIQAQRKAMFDGEQINATEGRAVLHTALRDRGTGGIATLIAEQLQRVKAFSTQLRAGDWHGSTGKPIRAVVNIGIGGSDLGPRFVCQSLEEYAHPELEFHFIANVDGACIRSLLKKLNPETTLFIIQSKTFTTQETLLNAAAAISWVSEGLNLEVAQSSPHFVAVTANTAKAQAFGIPAGQVFEFWDWVGGRYSLWSSIGLPIALMVGFEQFEALLSGAREMDEHFRSAPLEHNMPVILALLGVWYSNFLGAQSVAVIPYCERLGLLPSYLQQLDMESNGKSVTGEGEAVNCDTGPIVWGQTGSNGQHAFFQLLHQGTRLVPLDFIAAVKDDMSYPEQHRVLLGNMLAQAAALMQGQDQPGTQPHKVYPGNRPSNILLMEKLSPRTLGALIALYEHKVFVQGALWQINSFDQWGVELGKKMAADILAPDAEQAMSFDPSTEDLFERLKA